VSFVFQGISHGNSQRGQLSPMYGRAVAHADTKFLTTRRSND